MVTESDIASETDLKASGLDYTILFNSLYLDAVTLILGDRVLADGVRVPGGSGKGALVARRDLAEANAVVLAGDGHENRSYTLGASEAVSFADIAARLGAMAGSPVPCVDTPLQDFVDAKVGLGFPKPVAAFFAEWTQAVGAGELSEITGDLERLIGRRPTTCGEFLATSFDSLTAGAPAPGRAAAAARAPGRR